MTELLSCRQIVSLMVILGFMIHHMLRINIAIAIVDMTAKNISNHTANQRRFTWDEEEKNDILGCFFWGYILTNIPGGRLSELYGTRIVLGTSVLLSSILTILTPLASYFHYAWVIVMRVGLGLAMGVQWPSIPPMASKWVAPTDTSKFMSHMMASSLGAAVTLPVCGYLIAYFGWPSVFYVTGGIALIWSLLWFYLIYDSPGQHPRISIKEKEKVEEETGYEIRTLEQTKAPIVKILTSGPVWAIVLANTFSSFTFFVVLNQLPTYMYQVLQVNIKENGVLSSMPYVVRYSAAVSSCYIADRLRKKRRFRTVTIRKFFTTLCFLGPCVLFGIQAFWGNHRLISIMIFTISFGFNGLGAAGFLANTVDISTVFSGTIFGLANAVCCIAGYVTTKIVGLVTKENQDFEQWSYIFWILVAINFVAAVIYLIFASGELQSWDSQKAETVKMENVKSNVKPIDR